MTTRNSRTPAGTLRTPVVSYGTAITNRVSLTGGSSVEATTITTRTRRDGESPHLIDLIV